MKNLLDERPTRDLHGRLAWTRSFVDVDDCTGRDVLDIGCGFGWFELVALDRGARSVTCLEPTGGDLAAARSHFDDSRVQFRVASALELPFTDQSFDTVVCWEVLEHLPRGTELRAFTEMRRVLRPDGALYLSTPHAAPIATVADPAWWLIGHRHYSRAAVAGYAETVGFAVERLRVRGGAWEVAHLLNMYVAKWVFRRRPFFEDAITRRLDAEWQRPGFVDLFLCARRPGSPESR